MRFAFRRHKVFCCNKGDKLQTTLYSGNLIVNEELLYETADGVLTIALNRPEKKNALTFSMYREITGKLEDAENDPDIHVVIITGTGDIFTAGNDINSFRDHADLPHNERPSLRFMNTVSTFSKPLIGALNGHAVGIGATMLLHCDLIYSATGVNIKMPFLSLGAVPEFASSILLPRVMGHTKAFELFTLSQEISCEEAHALNWINGVMPAEELMPYVKTQALQLASRHPDALRAIKKLMKEPEKERLLKVIDSEAAAFIERLQSPEVQKIFAAFLARG